MNTPYTVLLQTLEVISAEKSSYIKHSLKYILYCEVSQIFSCYINAFWNMISQNKMNNTLMMSP